MNDCVFVVTRQGIYRHEITGVYFSKGSAVKRAKKCLSEEHDDYHEYDIYKIPLSVPIPFVDNFENRLQFIERWAKEGNTIFKEE